MRRMIPVVLCAGVLAVLGVAPAWGFTCPVLIRQAEDLVKKAEAGKNNADTTPLIAEAKRYLGEAKAHHESAKTKKDHGDAVRKAKFALALADEAIVLQTP